MPRPFHRALYGLLVAVCAAGPTIVTAAPAAAAGAARTGTVRVTSGTLTVRSGPATSAAAVGALRNGVRVRIACAVTGQKIKGTVRTSARWDRLTNGRYVAHAYVRGAGTVRTCPKAPTRRAPSARAVTGTVRSDDGPVRLRTGPSTAFPSNGSAASGARLTLTCAAVGGKVSGTVRATTQWDRLADGRYVSHAYVTSAGLPRCAGNVPTAPVTTTNAQFIAGAVPGARQGWRDYGVPASVTIAQAILESGWGRSALSATDRNYFGIKCFGGPGPVAKGCHTYQTWECGTNGACFTTTASFRTYATAADSFVDHGRFLRVNSRYGRAFAHNRNANEFARQIWLAGYATDPDYVRKLTTLMTTHNLHRYDP
jgi:flagellar protein FlgJ